MPAASLRAASRRAPVALVALALAAGGARAQISPDRTAPELPRGAIAIHAGTLAIDATGLNDAFSARGRPGIPSSTPTAGVETWVRWPHLVLAVSSQAYLARRAFATFYDTEFSGGAATIDLGLPVVSSRTFLLYPMAGVGSSRTNVTLRARGDLDFGGVVADPARNTDLTAWRWQAHLGVGASKVVAPRWWNVLLSLDARAGWTTPIGGTDWRSGPWDVANAPALGARGFYARAGVGLVLAKRGYAIAPAVVSLLPYVVR
jgi:hypothetical protein